MFASQEDTLLLCDACDLGYHLECCVPSLDGVPRGRWYCSTCANAGKPCLSYMFKKTFFMIFSLDKIIVKILKCICLFQ
jgi:hypothetical protein